MNDTELLGMLQQLGLDRYLPALFAFHTLANIVDALVPQPAPGSHWLPWRKVISILALNVLWAKNAKQPPLITWLVRAGTLLQAAAAVQQAQARSAAQVTQEMPFEQPVLIRTPVLVRPPVLIRPHAPPPVAQTPPVPPPPEGPQP